MQEQVTIRIQQARHHVKSGNLERAIALLEQSRALAARDAGALRIVLRELIEAYRLVGDNERAELLSEELASISPRGSVGEARIEPEYVGPSGSRRPAILIAAGMMFMIMTGAAIWKFTQRHYAPTSSDVAETAETSPSSVRDGEDAGMVPGAASGGPTQADPDSPPAGQRAGKAASPGTSPFSSEELVRDNIGLVLQVAEYGGTLNGQDCQMDCIVSSATCFAVGANGVLLTSAEVVPPEDLHTLPPNAAEWGMPTLTRRRVRLMVCFGRDESEHYGARLLETYADSRSAVLKVSRHFDRPLEIAQVRPGSGSLVRLVGFAVPEAIVTEADTVGSMTVKVEQNATSVAIPYTNMLSVTALDRLSEDAVVRNVNRRLAGMSYMEISIPTSTGSVGRPLLTENNQVAGIYVGQVPGYESLSLVAAIEPIRAEISRHL